MRHSADSPQTVVRILQTEIRRRDGGEFECDTFFPVNLGVDTGQVGSDDDGGGGGGRVERGGEELMTRLSGRGSMGAPVPMEVRLELGVGLVFRRGRGSGVLMRKLALSCESWAGSEWEVEYSKLWPSLCTCSTYLSPALMNKRTDDAEGEVISRPSE